MIEALNDDGFGRWRITTRTGTRYLLDLDQRLIRRVPSRGGSSASMRSDAHDVELLNLVHCALGAPLVLLLDLHLVGTSSTRRTTAEVIRIRLATSNGTS